MLTETGSKKLHREDLQPRARRRPPFSRKFLATLDVGLGCRCTFVDFDSGCDRYGDFGVQCGSLGIILIDPGSENDGETAMAIPHM